MITPEGEFYRRTSDTVCPVCKHHDLVIVQRVGAYSVMHTYVAVLDRVDFALHCWRRKMDEPACLRMFEPTGSHPTQRIDSSTLLRAVQAQVANQ